MNEEETGTGAVSSMCVCVCVRSAATLQEEGFMLTCFCYCCHSYTVSGFN